MNLPLIIFLVIAVLVIILAVMVILFIRRTSLNNEFGNYTLMEFIGRGGMATIYRAKNRELKRIVAVKILDQEWRGDRDLVYKFLKEGENLQRINSSFPGSPVVKAIEYSHPNSKGALFIAMEYLEGRNLGEIIKSNTKLDLPTKLHIIKEVARALHTSHELQIYHRDVSPENIIVNGKKATLIDFGIAKQDFSKYKTVHNAIVGKPFYMSPEQCSAKVVDKKSDIYSLGAVLFYLIEGKPPYNSKNHLEIIKMHQKSPLPKIQEPVPGELKDVVYKMLKKKPGLRPDAQEIVERLESIIAQEG